MMIRRAFTIVELLVVLAIVSVLAALLLPSIERSVILSERVSCLSNQKQLALLANAYATDNRGMTFNPGLYWNNTGIPWMSLNEGGSHGGPLAFIGSYWQDAATGNMYGRIQGWMRLASEGYIPSADILYCPGYARPEPVASNTGWYLESQNTLWTNITTRHLAQQANNSRPGCYGSYVHLTYVQDPTRGNDGFMEPGRPGVTLQYIAEKWRESKYVGPMLSACLNAQPGNSGYSVAHEDEGINVSFFDGSARWVSRARETGFNQWSLHTTAAHADFPRWQRERGTVEAP